MNFVPEIEFKTTAPLNELQFSKLQHLLAYVAQRSPFYQQRFRQNGISVNTISSLSQLTSLPTTTKDDLQQFNWDFLCVPRKEIVEYTTTSGTMGKPVTIGLSANDVKRLAYNEAVSF